MKIGFGRHAGKEIHLLPRGYLKWLLMTCDLDGHTDTAVRLALKGLPYDPPTMPGVDDEIERVCRPWEDSFQTGR